MLPAKVCMFCGLSETILPFGLRYLHLDLFQFLHIGTHPFIFNFVYTLSKVKLPPSPSSGRQRTILRLNSIIFSLDSSLSLPNWLRYGERREDPIVRQESDDPTSCHRGRRDGRFLNPSCTCLVDKCLRHIHGYQSLLKLTILAVRQMSIQGPILFNPFHQ